MLQEIAPHIYQNAYHPVRPGETDPVVVFDGGQTLLTPEGRFPQVGELTALGANEEDLIYLFAVDHAPFFLLERAPEAVLQHLVRQPVSVFRTMEPFYLRLVGITALHLDRWYRSNRFCGCCGAPTRRDETERALRCTRCGAVVYPRINPAIVVLVRDGNRALVTHYADRPMVQRYALVAGFTEIGETLEETVRREVREEVGLDIRNIRYYASQPWGFAGNLMVGFWADLAGSGKITLDTAELNEAVWLRREDIPPTPNPIDLTHTMMELFRRGLDPQ